MEQSSPNTIIALSLSPDQEDHAMLEAIFCHSKWRLLKARDLRRSLALLRRHAVSVVVCDRDAAPGTWTAMLECVRAATPAPSVIVSSRFADEALWTEALNQGAWDVLPKPFQRTEVLRSVKLAWEHWRDSQRSRFAGRNAVSAA